MARRPMNTSRPERLSHSVAEKQQDIARLRRRITELEAFDPAQVTERFSNPTVTGLQTAIASTLASVFGEGTPDYDRYGQAAILDHGPIFVSSGPWDRGNHNEAAEARRYLTEGKAEALALLQQAVRALEEEIEFALPPSADRINSAAPTTAQRPSRKVFVVHGHDEAAKEGLARFLEKLELEAIILHEQPDQGRTIMEKFEDCAADVGFAVVLLTPDDLGGAVVEPVPNTRARQNVIFELGYFAGKLGRGKTCLLRKGDVEMPSDLYGVIYSELDGNGGWKMKLVQELKSAGLEFDANKAWS